MKQLLVLALLAALGGCVVAPPGPGYGYRQSADPAQWRVVSVTPVPLGTGERVAASGDGARVEYSSRPVEETPVYVPQPVYVPEPAYWYPPVSLSLGLVFGRHWGGVWRHGHGRGRRR